MDLREREGDMGTEQRGSRVPLHQALDCLEDTVRM